MVLALVVAWLRELVLRSQARRAALEAEIKALGEPAADGEAKLTQAMELLTKASKGNPLLATSSGKKKQLLEAESGEAGAIVKASVR